MLFGNTLLLNNHIKLYNIYNMDLKGILDDNEEPIDESFEEEDCIEEFIGFDIEQVSTLQDAVGYVDAHWPHDAVEIHFDDASFRYEGTIGIAENVYFSLATNKEGDVTATDNLGNHFSYLRQPRD